MRMSEEVNATRRPLTVITASYSGLGSELSKSLAKAGYDLVLINRDPDRMKRQAEQLQAMSPSISVHAIAADLTDHRAIRRASDEIAGKYSRVDLLIHNAGVLLEQAELSSRGNDVHYEVNTVAPFLLTELLRPLLAASERGIVVAVGSSAMKMARKLNLPELRKPKRFKKFAPYVQTKLATVVAFRALAADYAKDGISLRVVDPGPTKTAMSKSSALPGLFRLFRRFYALPEAGAERIYAAATSSVFDGKHGIYIERGREARLPAAALDAETQKGLLALLRETTA